MITTRDLRDQLHTFSADRRHDPAVDPLTTKAAALEAQLRAARKKCEDAQQADVDATLLAEAALGNGGKVDHAALRRLRADQADAEHTARLVSSALEQVRQDIAKASAARADRDVAALTPVFRALAGLFAERATDLLEVVDVLTVAHATANAVLPGGSSVLQQGFVGAFTRDQYDAWLAKAEAANLLDTRTRRVA